MKRRTIGMGLLVALGFAATNLATACSNQVGAKEEPGTLNLPLATQGQSGATYRLRDATFQITTQYYYYDAAGGEGGASDSNVITVSSETDPDAGVISVNLERGYYYVRLLPGWRMEKVEGSTVTDVEATLLSGETQWAYVWSHSTSWVEYQFGLGDRALWFNGDLNVQIRVFEHPSEIYGGGGVGGDGPGETAGAPGVGGAF